MDTLSLIYWIGFILSLLYGTYIFSDDMKINLLDFLFVAVFSLLSWIMVLAFWVGQNIKYSEKDKLK